METATSVLLMDETAMRKALTRIAHEVVERAPDVADLLFVGIRTRGDHLAVRLADLVAKIEGRPVDRMALDISSYRDDRGRDDRGSCGAAGDLSAHSDQLRRVDRRHVILVDDVLYTGRSVRAALDALTRMARPARIQLAVLVDRGHRELPIRPDYVGKNIPTARTERVRVCVAETDGRDAVLLQKAAQAVGEGEHRPSIT